MRLGLFLLLCEVAVCLWFSPTGTDSFTCGTPQSPCRTLAYGNFPLEATVFDLTPNTHTIQESLVLEHRSVTIRAASWAIIDIGPYFFSLVNASVSFENITFYARRESNYEYPLFYGVASALSFEQCGLNNITRHVCILDTSSLHISKSRFQNLASLMIAKGSSVLIEDSYIHAPSLSVYRTEVVQLVNSTTSIIGSNFSFENGTFLNISASTVFARNSTFRALRPLVESFLSSSNLFFIANNESICPFNVSGIEISLPAPGPLVEWNTQTPACSALSVCVDCVLQTPNVSVELSQWQNFSGEYLERSAVFSFSIEPPLPSSIVGGEEFGFKIDVKDFWGNPAKMTSIVIAAEGTTSEFSIGGTGLTRRVTTNGSVTFSKLKVAGAPGNFSFRLTEGFNDFLKTYSLPPRQIYIDRAFPAILYPCLQGSGYVDSSQICETCPAGSFQRMGMSCLTCPEGAFCAGGAALATRKGYWWSGDSCNPSFQKCFRESNCCPNDLCDVGNCSASMGIEWDELDCGINRQGVLCSECKPGFVEWGSTCVDCTQGGDVGLAIGFFAPTLLLQIALFLNALRTTDSKAHVGIMVFFYQVAALLLSGGERLAFTSWALGKFPDLVTFPRCVFDATPLGIVGLSFVGPLSHFAFAPIMYLILIIPGVSKLSPKVEGLKKRIPSITAKVFLLASFLPLCTQLFSMLVCTNVSNVSVLAVQPAVECWQDEHSTAATICAICFALLCLLPFGVYWYTSRRLLRKYTAAELDDPAFKQASGHLYAAYRPSPNRAWFYPLALFQSLLISTLPLLIEARSMRLLFQMLLLMMFLISHLTVLPYIHREDTQRAEWHLLLLIVLAVLEAVRRQNEFLFAIEVIILIFPVLNFIVQKLHRLYLSKKKNPISRLETGIHASLPPGDGPADFSSLPLTAVSSTPTPSSAAKTNASDPSLPPSQSVPALPPQSTSAPSPSQDISSGSCDLKAVRQGSNGLETNRSEKRTGVCSPTKTKTSCVPQESQTKLKFQSSAFVYSQAGKRLSWPLMAALLTQAAAQVYVDPSLGNDSGNCIASSPCRSFGFALSRSSSNAQILVVPGTHVLDTSLQVNLAPYSSVQITSSVANVRPTLMLNNFFFGLSNCASCTIANINFMNATASSLVVVSSKVSVQNCDFIGSTNTNSVSCGGSINADTSSSLTISDCQFLDNRAFKGGAICFSKSLVVVRSTFTNCASTQFEGGAIAGRENFVSYTIPPTLVISSTKFQACSAKTYGAGVAGYLNASMTSVVFDGGAAVEVGGGFAIWGEKSNVTCAACNFTRNMANEGSAAYFESDTLSFKNCLIEGNGNESATYGAVSTYNTTFLIYNSTFRNNSAILGAAISFRGPSGRISRVEDSLFINNYATIFNVNLSKTGAGGVFFLDNTDYGLIAVRRSEFIENAAVLGGVVGGTPRNTGQMLFDKCSLLRNTASYYGGVSIVNERMVIWFEDCVIEQNRGLIRGGVFASHPTGGVVVILNSTISNNFAKDGGVGYILGATVTLNSTKFINNKGTSSGGVLQVFGSAEIKSDLSSFINNSATTAGGAISMNKGAEFECTGCVFMNNSANLGGAVWNEGGESMDFYRTTFTSNSAIRGGAVFAGTEYTDCAIDDCDNFQGGKTSGFFSNCKFIQNVAFTEGGAVLSLGQLIFLSSELRNNSANYGGALQLGANPRCVAGGCDPKPAFSSSIAVTTFLTGCVFESNRANYGGAISFGFSHFRVSNDSSSCLLLDASHLTFVDNTATRGTVAFWQASLLGVAFSYFTDNCCESCSFSGPPYAANNRLYSNYEATYAADLVLVKCPSSIGPNIAFDCIVEIQDQYKTAVFDLDLLVVATVSAECGGSNINAVLKHGRSVHHNFRLQQTKGAVCTINFTASQLDAANLFGLVDLLLIHPVTISDCPPSRYLQNGSCVPCPINSFSLGGTTACQPCLPNMVCGITRTEVSTGYFPTMNADGQLILEKCVSESCCPNARTCEFDIATTPDPRWSACGSGFGGPLCTKCLDGLVRWGGACVSCSSVSWGWVLLLLLFSFGVTALMLLVPSVSTDLTKGSMGWTTLHHKFVTRVLIFQSLAPILREHQGWEFLHGIELASLSFDVGVPECMGNFSHVGRVASGVLFPLLLFVWSIMLAAIIRTKVPKLPSKKEVFFTLTVLCIQPCLRSASAMVHCIYVGTEYIMVLTGETCYENGHLTAAIFSWIFLIAFLIFTIVGLVSRRKPELIIFLPENNLLNRMVAHAIVTVIAATDLANREVGVVFLAIVLGCAITLQGLDNKFPGFWLGTAGWLGLIVAAVLEFFISDDLSFRVPCLVLLTILVSLGVIESFVAAIRQVWVWRQTLELSRLKANPP